MKTLIIAIAIICATSAVAQTPFQKFAAGVVKTSDSSKAAAIKAVFGGGR